MIATYETVTRVARVVRAPELAGGSQVLAVTGAVLWVEPPGGNQHHVVAYSATTLRPLTDGFQNGGWNGSWLAVPDQGDLWFQLSGGPLECVSGKTGRLDARLALPNTVNNLRNTAESTPPGFVAADNNDLIIAASETPGAYSESGIAVYALDPRCDA